MATSAGNVSPLHQDSVATTILYSPMPPADSPAEPPDVLPHSLATNPILQELEAISVPVPDFAATLVTHVESDQAVHYPSMSERPNANAEALTRSARSTRQPYLTEEEFRDFTVASRRRVQQVQQNLNSTGVPTPQSYSNRTPAQQSLYDWAAYRLESESDDEVEPYTYRRGEDGYEERRELLSSLNESRRWRSQLRRDLEPREEPSGRVTLPSLQHLRRSVQDLPDTTSSNSAERPSVPRSPSVTAALSRLYERQRVERRERPWERRELNREPEPITDEERARVRRHLLDLRRRERVAQRLDKSRHRPSMPKTVNTLKYLSGLRNCPDEEATIKLTADLQFSYPSPEDVLTSTRVLTPPQPSSFLTPGTTFTGVQRAPQEIPASLLGRDRDYLRRMVARRNLHLGDGGRGPPISSIEEFASAILAADPSDQNSSGSAQIRSRLDRIRQHRQGQIQQMHTSEQAAGDSWPVSVTLHTLSLHPKEMTISGTMSASQIPDKLSPASPDHNPQGSSMESFFEGEIIDFALHTLETNVEGGGNAARQFPLCGPEVDARYWSGVGPFRLVAEGVRRKREQERKAASKELIETLGDIEREEEELEKEIDEELARCLGNSQWVESTVGGEGEWMLMRWKERCFVSPITLTTATNLSASTAEYHLRNTSSANVSNSTTMTTGCFGLTISGFYYIALHRPTGRIEGLYFDPGSQPFQELRLAIEGTFKPGNEIKEDVLGEPDVDGDDEPYGMGVKKWFPSVEFR